MGPNFLIREIAVALVGGGGVWALGTITPLQNGARTVLQGAVVVATLFIMARMGGLV